MMTGPAKESHRSGGALVLVLVAAPGRLEERLAREAAAIFIRHEEARPQWLGKAEACEFEIFVEDEEHDAEFRARVAREIESGLFAGRAVDVAIVDSDRRRKKLLVADMESTIIEQELLDELAGLVGLREKIAAITDRAMRGEIAFEAALAARVGLLAGLDAQYLARVLDERVTLMSGAGTLVRTMKTAGAYTALVSGGFSVFAGPVAERVGFDIYRSNVLGITEGKLTGEVVPPILGESAKLDVLRHERDRLGLAAADTLAVGDGANDRAMIRAAGLGVAFRAKPAVVAEAGATIVHGDLTALLFLQGYAREEFVG